MNIPGEQGKEEMPYREVWPGCSHDQQLGQGEVLTPGKRNFPSRPASVWPDAQQAQGPTTARNVLVW